jgi:hypothetical protein
MMRKIDLETMRKRAKNFVPDAASMLAVYLPGTDGHNARCVGFIMSRGKDGYEAFSANDRSLGVFPTQKARPMP